MTSATAMRSPIRLSNITNGFARHAGAPLSPWRKAGFKTGAAGVELSPPVRPADLCQLRPGRRAARDRRRTEFSSVTNSLMATLPVSPEQFCETFGPHLSAGIRERGDHGEAPDKAVKTHCCFCGQQCGIQLLVKDNRVIGFEPWMEFPFNQGKLCPKGVKRYLQGSHPDRLLHAYQRDPASTGGFKPVPYETAIAQVASEIQRIQSATAPRPWRV